LLKHATVSISMPAQKADAGHVSINFQSHRLDNYFCSRYALLTE
jgi:hypothetical protein